MTLEQAKRRADQSAETHDARMIVLNLNRAGLPLYVVRFWDARAEGDDAVVYDTGAQS